MCVTLGAYVRYIWCLCALHLVLMFVTFGAYVRYIWCLCSLHLVLMCVTLNAYVRYIWCLYALHLVLKWRLALANDGRCLGYIFYKSLCISLGSSRKQPGEDVKRNLLAQAFGRARRLGGIGWCEVRVASVFFTDALNDLCV